MADAAQRAVVFCDLDGTLVLDNSFHVFLSAAWSRAHPAQRVALGLRLGLRALGRLSGGHSEMKRRVLVWFARQPEAWRNAVIAATLVRLHATLSAPIRTALRRHADAGARIVLATAAPEIYARPFADQIGATDCLATNAATQFHALIGARKRAACAAWLTKHPPAHIIVLTDHPDDLPLLHLAHEAVIQAPPAVFAAIRDQLDAPAPHLHHIDPWAAQPEGGYWLWFDDRPSGPLDAWEVKTILSKHRYAQIYAGQGNWRPIGPGQGLEPATLRRDCPSPPVSRRRLKIHLHRRLQRDLLGVFH